MLIVELAFTDPADRVDPADPADPAGPHGLPRSRGASPGTSPGVSARLAARPAHRAVLAALHAEGRLVAAGPWADDTGALLVFDVGDRAELDRIMAADPYYRTPGVEIVGVREWTPVVGP